MDSSNSPFILFNVIYGEENWVLVLPRDDTVETLRCRIFDKSGIPPAQQILNWHDPTPTNDTELQTCSCLDDINFIILSPRNEIVNSPDLNPHVMPDKSDEIFAALSFFEYYVSNYSNQSFLLHACRLEDAIRDSCLSEKQNRKILMLYFHNKTAKFASEFCQNLANPEVKQLMSNFFLLGWNVEDVQYHRALKAALEKNNLTTLIAPLSRKSTVAFLIVPIKHDLNLFACIEGGNLAHFLSCLKKAVEYFKSESEIEENLALIPASNSIENYDLDSEKFQQLMLDRLGDRDYDSFDYYEHEQLKEKISFALFGPPLSEHGYEAKQKKAALRLYTTILKHSNEVAENQDHVVISFIYNCTEPLPAEKLVRAKKYPDYNPNTDLKPLPIFVLRKCRNSDHPCRIFIDDRGRVYKSWTEYLTRNNLDCCHMILPRNGRYTADDNGNVKLERHLSPACGIGPKILKATDIASTVMGLGSGAVFMVAVIPAVTVAPAALIAAGAAGIFVGTWSIARSLYTVYDRNRHKESMNFANSEARGAYINIIAGSLGFVGAGANVALTQLAANGVNIGRGFTGVVTGINIVNLGAGGTAIINSGYDVFDRWRNDNEAPSWLTIVQLSSSVLFFGHAVYNFRMAGTVVEEVQANALRDYQDSLRSNRHRKTFNKLLKETIRRQDGSVTRGQAEVIATIKNIQNKDEVFATLTRSNKDMNRNNVKFSAEAGEIKLNGHSINMAEFSQMDTNERVSFLSQMPRQTTESNAVQIRSIKAQLQGAFADIRTDQLLYLAGNLIKLFGNAEIIFREQTINALTALVNHLKLNDFDCWKSLERYFPNIELYIRLIHMIMGFLQKFVDLQEHNYQEWKANGSPPEDTPFFSEASLYYAERAVKFLRKAMEVYYVGKHLTSYGLSQIVDYFYTWLAKKVYEFQENNERERNRRTHSSNASAECEHCTVCQGFYYSAPNIR